MFNDILEICRKQPEILLFLSLGAGYYIGKFKFKGFSLGATASVLIMALVLGQIPGVKVPALLKTVSFALFVFCIGYSVGPQFFGGLKKQGLSYIWVALVVAVAALVTALALGKLFGFSPGTTAGLLAGALTTSAAIGTAEGAITHLPGLSEAARTAMETDTAIAYAITYIFGTVGGILMFSLLPRIMGDDLKAEAGKLEESYSGGGNVPDKSPDLFSWSKQLSLRAYRVENEKIFGKTVSFIEGLFPQHAFVEAVQRGKQTLTLQPDLAAQSGDILIIGSPSRKCMLAATELIGPEQDIADLVEIVGEVMEVCVLNKEIVGKTIAELGSLNEARGLFLRKITRQSNTVPILPKTAIERCDILQLIGSKEDVERAVKMVGFAERQTDVTDMVVVGCGVVLGTLIGLLVVNIAGIPISLGVGGGVLVSGLIFGWVRTLHPTYGQIPSASRWILQNLGLNLFIACVGLGAGSQALAALKTTGLSVFIAGVILTIIPVLVGYFFAKLFMKLNPVFLYGSLTGSRNESAALLTLEEQAESSLPVIGYATAYAVANVVLTIWGSLIVNIMHKF
ncbi:MAG: aspartate-alanine antiporter [Proteobacteria bacterium]|nr:aspartate-alanine antiporter [Pseudomonadota bacterium]